MISPCTSGPAIGPTPRASKVRLHSCGDVRTFVPDLIEIGVDMLNPLEVKAGMDPAWLKKTYGDKLAFHGGLNAALFWKMPELEQQMRDVVPVMKQKRRLRAVLRSLRPRLGELRSVHAVHRASQGACQVLTRAAALALFTTRRRWPTSASAIASPPCASGFQPSSFAIIGAIRRRDVHRIGRVRVPPSAPRHHIVEVHRPFRPAVIPH